MILNKLKRTMVASAFGLAALLGTNEVANAQTNRQVQRQQQRVERQQTRVDRQRQRLEQERIQLAQQRQREEQIRLQNMRNRNVYSNNNGYNNNRYRVYRNGSYYQTDNRGAELLRQAVNRGYQQGVRAGQADRNNRRRSSYYGSSVYQSGTTANQKPCYSRQYQ